MSLNRTTHQWLLALAATVWLLPAAAQNMRDPTLPPFGTGSSGGSGENTGRMSGLNGPHSVILVDGKFRLVVGTRLYSEGQQVGDARIERITETEIWLREGRELRKVSNFVGIKRRNVTETAGTPQRPCASSDTNPADSADASDSPASGAGCGNGKP